MTEPRISLSELLDDPEWERRALTRSLDHLRRITEREIKGGKKIRRWHVEFLTTELVRIPADYPQAIKDCPEWADLKGQVEATIGSLT